MATPSAVWSSVRTDTDNAGKVDLNRFPVNFNGSVPQAGDVVVVTSLTASGSSTTAPTVTVSPGWVEHYTDSFLFYGAYSCVVKVLSKVLTQADVNALTVAAYAVSGETAIIEATAGYGVREAAYASLGFAGQKLTDGTTNITFPALSAPAGGLVVRSSVPTTIDIANFPNTFPNTFPSGWTRFGLDDNNGNGDNFPAFWHPAPAPLATATTGQANSPYMPNIGFTISLADTAAPSSTTVNYGITNTADDVVDRSLSGSSAGMFDVSVLSGFDGARLYWAGIRFIGVAVPNGATITSATLTLKTAESATAGTWGVIKGVNSDNAPAWTITGPLTASKTTQSKTIVDGATQAYDVAAIVQAIVGRAGWSSGGALAFVSDPTGSTGLMGWVDYDASSTDCAQLSITYEAGGPDETAPTVTSGDALSVIEGDALSHALTANEDVTWTKVGGAEAASFTLTGSTLSLSAQTYPSGPFVVVVRATDAAGNWTEQTITVTVTQAPLIRFIGSATGTTNATMPAHQAGDLILCWAYRDGSNTLPTLASAGWTSLNGVTGANTNSARLVGKIAASSSEAVGTFTSATSVVVAVYRPKAGYALSFGAVAATTGASTTVSYPALTLHTADGSSWVAGFSGHRSVNTTLETPPSGMVSRATVLDATDEAAGHDTNGGVAAWTAQSVSVGGTSSGWRSAVVEIKVTYTSPTSPRKAPRYSSWL